VDETLRLPTDTILCGDAYALIRDLPDESVDLAITSPPYYKQRDYGAGIGDEPDVQGYVDQLVKLFQQCVRVIKPEGNIVFNVGDKYEDASLLLVPYRFAQAALATGIARLVNQITWVKQNPTPRQFKRRLVSSTEPFFHFAKADDYYYDSAAFQSRRSKHPPKRSGSRVGESYFALIDRSELTPEQKARARAALAEAIQEVHDGRIVDLRMKIRGIHAEAFGGQSGGRQMHMERDGFTIIRLRGEALKRDVIVSPVENIKGANHPAIYPVQVIVEFVRLLSPAGGIVLDPFMGFGSTAMACVMTNRRYIGFELNPEYCAAASHRLAEAPAALF